jgi:hypothetical protein
LADLDRGVLSGNFDPLLAILANGSVLSASPQLGLDGEQFSTGFE